MRQPMTRDAALMSANLTARLFQLPALKSAVRLCQVAATRKRTGTQVQLVYNNIFLLGIAGIRI